MDMKETFFRNINRKNLSSKHKDWASLKWNLFKWLSSKHIIHQVKKRRQSKWQSCYSFD